MSIETKRTCANCCSYEQGECMNGLGIVDHRDRCDLHKSLDEDRREDEAINRFRASLGLPPRVANSQEGSDV